MGHEVIWRVKDLEKVKRAFMRAASGTGLKNPDRIADTLLNKLQEELQSYPFQWPIQDEEPFEDTLKTCGLQIRYRREPANHLVEILEIDKAKAEQKRGADAVKPRRSG